ncbi:monovalent cation/H(+) antiporter subunit G [Nocardiopsis tropica]|uniref:Monovalent cation/H(+) antiporter subunit G n=1 Tax=Nocardiopsis tropica TaxID=109330 RepID=A0ABU7KT23_9ACTN|nr:monovalent cation/H(+) antiporter subunit G [Nocardiopsis umidischolae]MEE2052443.1 monovalent cation/H(+) antiporter subunit G [Nocardiopsis umidischolae]
MTPLEGLALLCVLAGAAVFAVGAWGLVRLDDFYARLHGVSIAAGLGTPLLLLGLLLWFPTVENAVKIGLALLVQLATAAVGGNALARAGYLAGTPAAPRTRRDALAEADRAPYSEQD